MSAPRTIGRYRIFDEIASGGMGTVHYGRMMGAAGFARTVAIKRLHPQFSKAPEFVEGLIDEARVAARIRHPNVVATLDVLAEDGEMLLVMEYVEGATLSTLARMLASEQRAMPVPIAVGIMTGALYGLHAAHEALSEEGEPLHVVHRDVSPQNVIVGVDGVARVVDFGVAKAVGRLQNTTDGRIKGKIAYMAPEQLRGRAVDRRADVYSASVVLWEILSGRRLFRGDSEGETMNAVLELAVPRVGDLRADVPAALDDVIFRAISRDQVARFSTAREMAVALEEAVQPASSREISEWLESVASEILATRRTRVTAIESSSRIEVPPAPRPPEMLSMDVSVGLTSPVLPPVKRSRRMVVLLAAGGVLLVLVGIGGKLALTRSHPTAAPPPPPPSEMPSASAAPVGPVAIDAGPPFVAITTTSASAPAPAPKPTARPKPVVDCNPPYTIDSSGARHWKKGC